MEQQGLRELYVDNLKDMYSAEKQILRALPKMIEGAANEDLANALEEHRAITEQQVTRLETIFGKLGSSARGKKCKGMEGLLEEGAELLEQEDESDVRDAGIIVAAQKVEHYEIAAYGSLRTFAELLGDDRAVQLLEESLEEEKDADEKLTALAQSCINLEAANQQEEPQRKQAGRR